MAINCRWFSIE